MSAHGSRQLVHYNFVQLCQIYIRYFRFLNSINYVRVFKVTTQRSLTFFEELLKRPRAQNAEAS